MVRPQFQSSSSLRRSSELAPRRAFSGDLEPADECFVSRATLKHKGLKSESSTARPWWRKTYDATFGALWRLVYGKLIQPVLVIRDSSHALALGLALGMFVAMTPTVGVQMPMVFVLASVFGANRLAGIAIVWISNPVTVVPFYYGYYLIGRLILGGNEVSYEDVGAVLKPREGESSWDALLHLFEVFGWPLWLGSFIVAVVLALPTYPLARRFFEARDQRRRARIWAKLSSDSSGVAKP
ncbi:MAG: DUF2062 domain-containing protein [Planctomycetota bacterium]